MDEKRREERNRQESRRILERVERESDLFMRMAARARDHFAARDAGDEDRIELWGRRIGRVLGLVFALFLIVWLWSRLTGGTG
ncbi:hypothetical protein [Chelativorans intermedius]|uniref:Uncharacterized protein n=1 Tax=Chelativorans intermedius TaxID=515947 RepID=A0ABV6DBG3_9HYPH|nr:hypothetical protein [Chelativorans intermedius]MCT8999361.1 hypothetical protein [Chelativorans intermedius]